MFSHVYVPVRVVSKDFFETCPQKMKTTKKNITQCTGVITRYQGKESKGQNSVRSTDHPLFPDGCECLGAVFHQTCARFSCMNVWPDFHCDIIQLGPGAVPETQHSKLSIKKKSKQVESSRIPACPEATFLGACPEATFLGEGKRKVYTKKLGR